MRLNPSCYLALVVALCAACSSKNGVEGAAANQATDDPYAGFTLDGGDSLNGGKQQLTEPQYVKLTTASCSKWTRDGEAVPTSIEFVVDVSGSMLSTAPTTGDQTKWAITNTALGKAIDALPNTTGVGMLLFPNRDTTSNNTGEAQPVSNCLNTDAMIPLVSLGAAGSAQRLALANGLATAKPAGGTPTHDAYDYALTRNGLIDGGEHPGHRYMVLITDGQPTLSKGCIGTGLTTYPVDYNPIVAEIATANSSGVKTFVIGAPGSEKNDSTNEDVRYWLSAAARTGGTPITPDCSDTGTPDFCHFDMSTAPDFAAGFSDALTNIAAQVTSCSYSVPLPPQGQALDLDKVNVILRTSTPEYFLVLRAQSSNCTEGWYLDTDNNVVLCSATCQQIRADSLTSLHLLFGCATFGNPLT
jgi:hypothetical protein